MGSFGGIWGRVVGPPVGCGPPWITGILIMWITGILPELLAGEIGSLKVDSGRALLTWLSRISTVGNCERDARGPPELH